MNPVDITRRNGPLVLSIPHGGTHVPAAIHERLTEIGRELGDTDWHLDRLYDFADELDATVVRANASRYVIDLNRDPSGLSLYPGLATTGLCPTVTFDGKPLYAEGEEPDPREIDARRKEWYEPYHSALFEEIERVRALHGYALLYDCHSIRSNIPRLFDGELPVLNIGTNHGESCARDMEAVVLEACGAQPRYSYVLNGRFRGGWITRHYGRPAENVHALQMELAQRAYMHEHPPWPFDDGRAASIRPILRQVLQSMRDWAHRHHAGD